MLTTIELEAYFFHLSTPIAGRRLVEKARKESPVRAVQSHMGNVITHYQSRKMGRTLAAESRTVEFPAMVSYEFDDTTLEYYPQPVKLDIIATDNGTKKPFRLQHTPDFLILSKNQIRIEEWREESRLLKLAEKYPNRYEFNESGWRIPEIEAQLAEIGLTYRLRTPAAHPHQFLQNLQFLADFLSSDYPPVGVSELAAIKSCFDSRASMTIAELIAEGQSDPRSQETGSSE
jgi:putative transposase